MSMIHKGHIVETELSKNSKGGTEMMRKRVLDNVDSNLLSNAAIHFSRPREIPNDVKLNILYCHDLAEDPENAILKDGGWKTFDHFVFVTQWQRDQYITYYGLPYSKCTVIPNAVEKEFLAPEDMSHTGKVRFIYHTTPHRGLELLYPIFDELSKHHDNIHLDVYSSFAIYGWAQRDDPYVELFTEIHNHPNMTYHGSVPNAQIIKALETADVFLYPNIWKETSCIALIEAIKSGVLCIHPNYGALTEVSQGQTLTYDYSEDNNMNANAAYSIADQVLNTQKEDNEFLKRFTTSDRAFLSKNSIPIFANSWNKLLKELNG
jgi:UDP-glucose:(glucosyl)LPS alpha-1,2-glucosyltransferase